MPSLATPTIRVGRDGAETVIRYRDGDVDDAVRLPDTVWHALAAAILVGEFDYLTTEWSRIGQAYGRVRLVGEAGDTVEIAYGYLHLHTAVLPRTVWTLLVTAVRAGELDTLPVDAGP